MALFGRKGQNAAQGNDASPASADTGTVTLEKGSDNGSGEATPKTKLAKNKKEKAPRSSGKQLKSGSIVGLNIGSNYIKAVEVTSKGGTLTVTAMGAVPTPPDSISNGVVMSVGALAEALKELWRTAGIKSKTVVSSVAATGSLVVRVIEVPKMTDRELSDNMKVDADRYIPFPPSEVVMDFKALRELPTDPDSPNMEVLLAAAQREIIDLHIRAVQSARLDPRAIDVEPLAGVRAIQFAQARNTGTDWIDYNDVSALVNIGATSTEISVLRGDLVVFTRTVPGGGNSVTQAIADGLGLAFPDAERIKIEAADALPPHGVDMGQASAEMDDFASFGLDEDTAPISFDDFDTTPMNEQGPSTDPFDLDFFNQGPNQDEQSSGHGQMEGEKENEEPFSFNFSFADDPSSKPAAAGPNTPAGAGSAFSIEGEPAPKPPASAPPSLPQSEKSEAYASSTPSAFSEEEFAIPSKDPQPVREPVSMPAEMPELEGNLLPTRETAPDPDYDMAEPGRGGVSFNFDDDSLLPSVDTSPSLAAEDSGLFNSESVSAAAAAGASVSSASGAESPAPPEPEIPSISDAGASFAPVPSAFDFGDLDLPTLEPDAPPPVEVSAGVAWDQPAEFSSPAKETPAEPVSAEAATESFIAEETQPAPAAPFSFSFGDEPASASAPTPVSLEHEPQPTETSPAEELNTPTQPFSFGDLETPAEAETSGATESDETFAITEGDTAPAAIHESFSESSAGDFDLDSIFGEDTPAATASIASPAPSAADEDTFDLGSIGGDLDDFGGGFAASSDSGPDLSNFGAGLTEQALTGVDPLQLYSAVNPVVEELANELRRSLEYHLSRFPDASISRISLIGGGAALLNLDYYLTQMLGIPTSVGNPFSQIEISAPRLPPEYAQDNGALCAVALGLALRDFVA